MYVLDKVMIKCGWKPAGGVGLLARKFYQILCGFYVQVGFSPFFCVGPESELEVVDKFFSITTHLYSP